MAPFGTLEPWAEYPIGSFAAFGVNAVVSSEGWVSTHDIVTSV